MQMRVVGRQRAAVPPLDQSIGLTGQRDLSPRQHQILDLLRAGKVNKEIARELGIGLGTVKQHVVALFKKLDVSNRTMAVSRGIQLQSAPPVETLPALAREGLLEYRPCIVLSAMLDEAMSPELGRKMQQTLAAYAADHDALFLARKGHAGDLILGIQRATEQDLYLALCAANKVFRELDTAGGGSAGLRGGLTAGLAIASMNRTGGWSGEAIASIAITQGRELAGAAVPGQLLISPAAQELMGVQNPNSPGPTMASLSFASLDLLPWQPGGQETLPFGRDAELQLIDELVERARAATGSLLQLSGETGMGKSRLCRYAAERVIGAGGRAHRFVCRPDGRTTDPFVSTGGNPVSASVVLRAITGPATVRPEAVIIDDCHYLVPKDLAHLVREAAVAPGKFVMLAGRRFAETGTPATHSVRLGRLEPQSIEKIAAAILGRMQTPAKTKSIVRRAAGVPLFAIELARQRRTDSLPLSLRVLIGARLDGLRLDRALLRSIARDRAGRDVTELAREMNETPEAVQAAAALAVAAGVLGKDGLGRLRFVHPLLRQAIDLAGVE